MARISDIDPKRFAISMKRWKNEHGDLVWTGYLMTPDGSASLGQSPYHARTCQELVDKLARVAQGDSNVRKKI